MNTPSIAPKPHADIDEWQTQMQLRPMRIGSVHLYAGGLKKEERSLTGVAMVDSVEEAIARSVDATSDPHVAVVPEGPYVVPVFRPVPKKTGGELPSAARRGASTAP